MIRKLFLQFSELNSWLKVIVCFCLLGVLSNGILIGRDLHTGSILLRLHLGFFILYAAQIVFIFVHERLVWILAALQGILALLTNADFTFFPLTQGIGRILYRFLPEFSLEAMQRYKYILISASFTLQMLSAYAEFSLLTKEPALSSKQQEPSALPASGPEDQTKP